MFHIFGTSLKIFMVTTSEGVRVINRDATRYYAYSFVFVLYGAVRESGVLETTCKAIGARFHKEESVNIGFSSVVCR